MKWTFLWCTNQFCCLRIVYLKQLFLVLLHSKENNITCTDSVFTTHCPWRKCRITVLYFCRVCRVHRERLKIGRRDRTTDKKKKIKCENKQRKLHRFPFRPINSASAAFTTRRHTYDKRHGETSHARREINITIGTCPNSHLHESPPLID